MKGKRLIAMTAAFLTFLLSIPASATTLNEWLESQQSGGTPVVYEGTAQSTDYVSAREQYVAQNYRRTGDSVRITAADLTESQMPVSPTTMSGVDRALVWEKDNQYMVFSFSVAQSGLYVLRIRYQAVNNTTTSIVRSMSIDGQIPFDESENLTLYRQWADEGEPTQNSDGDDIRSNVVQVKEWQTADVYDAEGLHATPLEWYLSAGTHTLKLSMVENPVALDYLEFYSLEDTPAYADVLREYQAANYSAAPAPITFEAESQVISKSLSVIRKTSDSDPATSPYRVGKITLNTIGGVYWQAGNASITWEFTVEEDGLYQLAFREKQSYRNGLPSYRRIAVDGTVPFREWEAAVFTYSRQWRTMALADGDGNPYLLYLKPGQHTLTMTVTQGDFTEIIRTIRADSQKLSNLMLQIVMLTGQNPDPNYDYRLDTRIPNLLDTLRELVSGMDHCMESMYTISDGIKTSLYSQFNMMKKQVEALIADPYKIPMKQDDLNNVLTVYGSSLTTLMEQPLTLDTIQLIPAGEEAKGSSSSLISRLYGGAVNFLNSFVKDYNGVGLTNTETTDTLTVWVARGKDWGTLIQQLADSDFTPRTHVGIKVNILPSGQLNAGSANALLLAVSSGMAPDIGLGSPVESTGEFAIRNAVVDLAQFDDYEEVTARFNAELLKPMTYKGGVYGLPETQTFKALFYRKDILSDLGLEIPTTWEQLYNTVLPVLYQNNMEFYYPIDFDPFIYQRGASYYNSDLTVSGLNTPEAYQAVNEMFNLFTIYGVPVSANFFNRFRSGEMPLGVGTFTDYMQLRAAAPEISGRWGIAVIPGHKQADGTINHSQGGAAQEGAMILSQTGNPEGAWEFLKWWTSEDIQTRFGNEIEASNGETARWNSANTAAYETMPWPTEDLRVITEALSQVNHTEVVLGGYFTSRHLSNAFNRACISSIMTTRDSLEKAVKDINKELIRRQLSAGVTSETKGE